MQGLRGEQEEGRGAHIPFTHPWSPATGAAAATAPVPTAMPEMSVYSGGAFLVGMVAVIAALRPCNWASGIRLERWAHAGGL